jgi:hypothetical protein
MAPPAVTLSAPPTGCWPSVASSDLDPESHALSQQMFYNGQNFEISLNLTGSLANKIVLHTLPA